LSGLLDLKVLFIFISRKVRVLIALLILDSSKSSSDEASISIKESKLLLEITELLCCLRLAFSLVLILVILDDVVDLRNHLLQSGIVNLGVLDDCLAEVVADLHQHAGVEVEVGVFSEVTSTEARFQSK